MLDGILERQLDTPRSEYYLAITESPSPEVIIGFVRLGLHRITANIGPTNTSSMRLVESLGFQREGTIRDHVHTNGAWRDSVSFSLLEGEWQPAAE